MSLQVSDKKKFFTPFCNIFIFEEIFCTKYFLVYSCSATIKPVSVFIDCFIQMSEFVVDKNIWSFYVCHYFFFLLDTSFEENCFTSLISSTQYVVCWRNNTKISTTDVLDMPVYYSQNERWMKSLSVLYCTPQELTIDLVWICFWWKIFVYSAAPSGLFEI